MANSFNFSPIPQELIQALFAKLGVSVNRGKLVRTWENISHTEPQLEPVDQLNTLIKSIKCSGAQASQLLWRRFDYRKLPVLLWCEGQWMLAEPSKDGTPKLTDAKGNELKVDDAKRDEGIVLWIKVTPAHETPLIFSSQNIAARLVWQEMFRRSTWLRDILLATLIINVLALSTSLFSMQVYDRVIPTMAYSTLWTLVAGMAGVVVIDWLLKIFRARTLDSVASRVDKAVSQKVYDHLMSLRLDLQPRSLGTLAAQVSGLEQVRQVFSSGIVFVFIDLPFALMFILFIAIVGGQIVWVYIALLPTAIFLGLLTKWRLRRLMKQQITRSNERQGLLVDSIRGVETIRSNNATWRFSEQWKSLTDSIAAYNLRQKDLNSSATTTTSSLASIAYVSSVVVGVHLIEAGTLTMGSVIACSMIGGRVISPVVQSVQYIIQWQNMIESLNLVNRLLLIEPERRQGQELLMPKAPPEQVHLEKIRFSYPSSPVRQLDISQLTIRSGDRVMLLGPIGSGKSTLLKIMAGLYFPGEGHVRLGESDLWETDTQVIANHISYLPQQVHLFKGTLYQNLSLSGAVNDDKLLKVCQELGINTFAAQNPKNMALEIGEGGEGVSGGQRQLIGLARVIMAQPRIWLLDEPTASLDGESEQIALNTLDQYIRPEDMVVFVTHRPIIAASIANRVLILNEGKVVQDGTPQQILPRLANRKPPLKMEGALHA